MKHTGIQREHMQGYKEDTLRDTKRTHAGIHEGTCRDTERTLARIQRGHMQGGTSKAAENIDKFSKFYVFWTVNFYLSPLEY